MVAYLSDLAPTPNNIESLKGIFDVWVTSIFSYSSLFSLKSVVVFIFKVIFLFKVASLFALFCPSP